MPRSTTSSQPSMRQLPPRSRQKSLGFSCLSLLLSTGLALAGCQPGQTPGAANTQTGAASDTPPNRLPLKASLEIGKLENDSFSTRAASGAYALQAVVTGAWVSLISSLLLAGPALVVGKASEQDPDCSKTGGTWRCDWDDVAITGDLRARALGSKTAAGLPDFSFSFSGNFMGTRLSDYEGLLCRDCTWQSGTWTAHDLKEKAAAMTLVYRFTGDGDKDFEPNRNESADLKLSLTRKIGELPQGSSVQYQAAGNQRTLIVVNGGNGDSRTISWDEASKAGRISIREKGKTEFGCWDSKGADTPCRG